MQPAVRRVVASLAIMLGYMMARYFVYAAHPLARSGDWYRRDTFMTLPRLAFFGIALWTGRRWWTRDDLGFHVRGARVAVFVGTALTLVSLLRLRPPSDWHLTTSFAIFFGLTTIPVALFEETLFRGILLNALKEWRGATTAIWISSIVFAVSHIQAQPLYSWPSIGLIGLTWAILRMRGVSIAWLMSTHWLYDWFHPILGTNEGHPELKILRFAILCAIAWLCWKRVASIPAPATAMKLPRS